MSRKAIAFARIILNIQLNHLIFVAAAVSLMGVIGSSDSHLLFWIGTGIVPVFLYFWRVKVKKIAVFFIGMCALLTVGVVLPLDIFMKFLTIGMILLYCIFTVRKKLTERPELVELVSPAVFVLVIGAMTFKNHIYTGQCFGIAWGYLIGYFLYHFMTEYLNFVNINENSASNMPEKELFTQGVKQVGVFTGITIGIAWITSNTDWIAKIVTAFGGWIKGFLKYIFAGIAGAIEEESVPEAPVVDMGQDEGIFEPVEYSELWLKIQEILEALYYVIVFLILVAIVFFGVRLIVHFVKENFTKIGKKKANKEILSNQDIRESCREEVSKKEKRVLFDFLSNEQRIRAIYKKKVLQEKVKIVGEAGPEGLAYLTAKECCDKIEAAELKEVYEKVRYSSEKVTGEDVRRVKK